MAEKVTFDGSQKLILVDKATPDAFGRISLNVQVDLYSDGKEDWLANANLNKYYFPIEPIGGQDVSTGKLGTTYVLQYDWRIQPYEGDHELQIVGNLYTDTGESVILIPSGWDYGITVVSVVSTLVEVATTDAGDIAAGVWNAATISYSGEGTFGEVVQQEPVIPTVTQIADGVWDEPRSGHIDSGTFGGAIDRLLVDMLRVLGLTQENYYLDQTSYDVYEGQKQMTSGRIRLYSDPASVGTNDDVIATYTVTANWTGAEMDDYSVKKQ